MMTSSNGNIFRVTGPLCGEFTGPGEFHTQRPVTRSFDVFFDLRLNKPLSKQSWGWWFQTLSRSLWRHRNVMPPYNHGHAIMAVADGPAPMWHQCSCNHHDDAGRSVDIGTEGCLKNYKGNFFINIFCNEFDWVWSCALYFFLFLDLIRPTYRIHTQGWFLACNPQWEMFLQSNTVSHWLGTNLESTTVKQIIDIISSHSEPHLYITCPDPEDLLDT